MDNKYRFIINGEITSEPLEWEDIKFELAQDPSFFGYFRIASLDNISLIGDAAKKIKIAYDSSANPVTSYVIQRKGAMGIYYDFQTCTIDYNTYKETINDGEGLVVSASLLDTNLQSKLRNRQGIDINVGNALSIEQTAINGFNLIDATILRKKLRQTETWEWSEYLQTVNPRPGAEGYISPNNTLPQALGNTRLQRYGMTYNSGVMHQNMYNDIIHTGLEKSENGNIPFASSQAATNYNVWLDRFDDYFGMIGTYEPKLSGMIMAEDPYDRTIHMTGTFNFDIEFLHTYVYPQNEIIQNRTYRFYVSIYLYDKATPSDDYYRPYALVAEDSIEIIAHDGAEDIPTTEYAANYKDDFNLFSTINTSFVKPANMVVGMSTRLDYEGDPDGWKIALAAGNDSQTEENRYSRVRIDGTGTNLKVYYDTNDEEFPDSTHKGALVYETLQSNIEQMVDATDVFYSDFFGRTDLGYANDGDGSGLLLTNGLLLRNAFDTPNGDDPNLTVNFSDLYKTLDSIYGLQMYYDATDGKIHIEKRDWTRSDNVTILNYSDIEKDDNNNLIFSDLKVGNDKIVYEDINGLNEFNGILNFTTPLNIKENTLDLVTKYNTDYTGVEHARRLSYANSDSTDTKYDDNVFLIEVELIGGTWTTKTVADKYVISGMILEDYAFNIGISPKRMLLNNTDLINACMYKAIGQDLVSQTNDVLPQLTSQLSGTTDIVVEQANYTTETGEFKPTIYTMKADEKQVEEVFLNLNNKYTFEYFGKSITGVLYSIEDELGETKLKIIETN